MVRKQIQKELDACTNISGGDEKDTVVECNENAFADIQNGDYRHALELFERALEIRIEEFGQGHPETAMSYSDIAGVYCNMGDYHKTMEYYQKAYAIWLCKLGEGHPTTVKIKNDMATIYATAGFTLPFEVWLRSKTGQ
ncbi:MAG: tetratricopeptide repeat protein [Dehalococcoidia bacterium]|nr:tetratricopeptide repeat protein [Dehalococcoidia bacterium]